MTHGHRPTPALAPATHALLPGPSFGARSSTRHHSGLARKATKAVPTDEEVLEKAIVEDTDSAWQKVRYLLRDVQRLGQPFWNGPNKKQAWLWTGQYRRPAAPAWGFQDWLLAWGRCRRWEMCGGGTEPWDN